MAQLRFTCFDPLNPPLHSRYDLTAGDLTGFLSKGLLHGKKLKQKTTDTPQ